jgi:hypothetical protein
LPNDLVFIRPVGGIVARMRRRVHLSYCMHRDVRRKEAVEAMNQRWWQEGAFCKVKMSGVGTGVHTRIGTATARCHNRLTKNRTQCQFKGLLDRRRVGLALPTTKARSVVSQKYKISHPANCAIG